MKIVMMTAIALFSIIAFWLGFYAYITYQNDMEQHATVRHAVLLAENRVSQAHDYFQENRHHFDLLASTNNLKEKEIAFLPYIIISVVDNELWRPQEWGNIPWLSAPLLDSVMTLLHPDTPGARDNAIIFHGNSMDYTLFATPLHAVLRDLKPYAWVIINYGEIYSRDDRMIVSTEAIEDGFSITITSVPLRNESQLYLILTGLFVVLSLASVFVLIWGIKTYRFISEPDTTTRTILIMLVVIMLLMFGTYLFFNTMDIRFT